MEERHETISKTFTFSSRDMRFWFQITWTKSRAARGDQAIILWPAGRWCGERQPEICPLNWGELHWELFSSSKTTKRAVRRYVKQSRPTVNRDHSHAWQLFLALLGCLPRYSPPACVSNCLSSSSPSTTHNYSMKMKNGFSKTANTSRRDFTHKKKISWISEYDSVVKPAPKAPSLIFTSRSWLKYFTAHWIYFSRFAQP